MEVLPLPREGQSGIYKTLESGEQELIRRLRGATKHF